MEENMESENEQKNRPVYTERRGRLDLAIWGNETPNGVRFSTEISRSWKDGEEYQTTTRFDEMDLLYAAKLAQVADDWIADERRKQR